MIGVAGDGNKKVIGKEIEPLLKAMSANPRVRNLFSQHIFFMENLFEFFLPTETFLFNEKKEVKNFLM